MRNWWLLYIGWGFRKFAFVLINIFGPIFFFTHGYSFGFVCVLIGLQSLANAISRPIITRFMTVYRQGNLLAGCMLFLTFLNILISHYYGQKIPLMTLFILIGLFDGAEWSVYQYIFTKVRYRKRLGSQVGIMNNVSIGISALGLALGGYISVRHSVTWNYVIASIAMFLAAICMILIKTPNDNDKAAYKMSVKDIYRLKKDWFSGVGNLLDMQAIDFIWPFILVAILSRAVDITGYYLAAATVVSFLLITTVGRFSDKNRGANKSMNTGLILGTIMHGLRITAIYAPILALPLTLIGSPIRTIYDLPYNVFFFERMEVYGRLRYMTIFEFITNLFVAAFWLGLGLALTVFSLKIVLVGALLFVAAFMPANKLIPRKM